MLFKILTKFKKSGGLKSHLIFPEVDRITFLSTFSKTAQKPP